jgi:hypothetical protein
MSASGVRAGSAYVEIGADPKAFFRALGSVKNAIGDLGKELASAGTKLALMGGGAVAGMVAATKAFSTAGSELLDMSKRTGASVETLSRLGYVAEHSGATLEDVAKGMVNLNRSFDEAATGSKEANAAFARLGLTSDKLGRMTPEERFMAVVAALNAIPDPAVRAALAMRLFGKNGLALLPMIAEGTASIQEMSREAERLGVVMSAEDAKAANAFGSALKTLHAAVSAVSNAIGAALAPTLTDIAQTIALNVGSFAKFLKQNAELVQIALKVAAGMFLAGSALTAFGNVTYGLTKGVNGLKAVFSVLAIPVRIVTTSLGLVATAAATATVSTGSLAAVVGGRLAVGLYKGADASIKFGVAIVKAMNDVPGMARSFMTFVGGLPALFSGVAATISASFAPLLLIFGSVAAAIAVVYASGLTLEDVGTLASDAFSGMLAYVQPFADSAVGAFNQVYNDASVVFSDLKDIAMTSFGGIQDALAAGDLAGAAEMGWLGLQAAFQRGMAAVMSYVDPFVTDLQNAFTYIYTNAANSVDSMWTYLQKGFNTGVAVIKGILDNMINGVVGAFDALMVEVQKSWNYVQSFFRKGFDLKKENEKVQNKADARARQRELERPGIKGRTAKADEENAKLDKQSADRKKQREAEADNAYTNRASANQRRNAERQANANETQGRADAKRSELAANKEAFDVLQRVGEAKTVDDIRALYADVDRLRSAGASAEALDILSTAIDDQLLEVDKDRSSAGQDTGNTKRFEGIADAGVGPSKAEVAGTFSSVALGGMAFGSSLDQKQLDALNQIARNTDPDNADKVAA